ncbi:ArsR family transcriptional regulator [Halegenticoccus tardaugens]|uniref:ArsR family transcriptional regulator n=1 Tax=Halegenticoccus tardaugens TaxID=2071624 RepID=UPI00100B0718|nr:ArsR family transcriptional regulator [Halegenticoccus tardaugens]
MTKKDYTTGSTLDVVLDVLTDKYCRFLLFARLEPSLRGAADLRVPPDIDTEDEAVALLEADLTHVHLPRLEAEDVIEWDPDDGEVRRGARFEEALGQTDDAR